MSTKIKYGTKELERDFGKLTFAKLLLSYRLSEELSQVEMAKRLNISKQSLCDLEKGRKIPSPQRAWDIAKKLGAKPESFLELALEDQLRASKMNFKVSLEPTKKVAA